MNTDVLFQYSPWFLLLCVLVGVAYAAFMYQKKYSFTKNQRIALAFVRGLLVSTLCFLLLNPLFKRETLRTIPATVVIALDDSRSIKTNERDEILSKVAILSEEFNGEDISTAFRTLNTADAIAPENIKQVKFDGSVTNISQLLSNLSTEYEGQNLTDVIVVSDGIVNAGVSPTFATYPFNIHTVGVGDTTRKKDVRVLGIFANQVAYVGNTFPVEVEVNAFGYAGQQTTVLLKRNDVI
ncbi:MAG: VWA domain-containing protein, partial [Spirosomaceae bacterium]|nr:VWA domain-containing protein [Spirosomataceae bacterium]